MYKKAILYSATALILLVIILSIFGCAGKNPQHTQSYIICDNNEAYNISNVFLSDNKILYNIKCK